MITPATATGPPAFSFKASRQPMLWAAVAYSAGIVVGVYAWRPALWWVVAGVAFLFAASYFARRRSAFAWALALSVSFLAGALHIPVRNGSGRIDTGIQPYADRQELQIVARVVHDGRIQQAGPEEIRQTVDVESEEVRPADGQVPPIHSQIRLSIYSPRSKDAGAEDTYAAPAAYDGPVLHYGDRVRFLAKLRRPRNFRNPGAFDYEGYLADRGMPGRGSPQFSPLRWLLLFFLHIHERIRACSK